MWFTVNEARPHILLPEFTFSLSSVFCLCIGVPYANHVLRAVIVKTSGSSVLPPFVRSLVIFQCIQWDFIRDTPCGIFYFFLLGYLFLLSNDLLTEVVYSSDSFGFGPVSPSLTVSCHYSLYSLTSFTDLIFSSVHFMPT